MTCFRELQAFASTGIRCRSCQSRRNTPSRRQCATNSCLLSTAQQPLLQPFLTSISIVNRDRNSALPAMHSGGDLRMPATRTGGSKRGFAAMDPAKQREIASKGGKASHGGGRKASTAR